MKGVLNFVLIVLFVFILFLSANAEEAKANSRIKLYSLQVKVGFQYDDHVRLDDNNGALLDEDDTENEKDFAFEGYFSSDYTFINTKAFKMGAGYSHYQTLYGDVHEYNLTGSIGTLYTKYHLDPFTLAFSYVPSYFMVDSEGYLLRHELKPEIRWKVGKNIFTRLSYSYRQNDYLSDDTRDGYANNMSLDVYYCFSNNRGYLFGEIGYEDNTASRMNECYEQVATKLGISFKLPAEINLDLVGKYYNRNYHAEREDHQYFAGISLSRELDENLEALAEFDYTKNNSSMELYEYARKVASLSVVVSY
ncbi:surface lipoprotein assembly modifier [Desulfonema magnum]|uniref:DUF560 n=1 Tax=Desulfonema magnum TaxID=45655 RepID=A0A975BH41_9BACT|nr:surface lipoprotein assembly modifier [Desulfonema magnum]QTA85104.1 DUF560 [Desulfonema magnum]